MHRHQELSGGGAGGCREIFCARAVGVKMFELSQPHERFPLVFQSGDHRCGILKIKMKADLK